jgi:OOP family OmpA-OmpF porin
MSIRPALAIIAGAVLVAASGYAIALPKAKGFVEPLAEQARAAIVRAGGQGITPSFASATGAPSRHPVLMGGRRLSEETRARVARAVAAVPGCRRRVMER